jgi:predicted DCC family thiol-disulfide oxidoreductase YuxK
MKTFLRCPSTGMKQRIPPIKPFFFYNGTCAFGTIWFIIAKTSQCIPKLLRDFSYDLIAKTGYRSAGKIDTKTSPVLPKNYQSKILL